MATKANILTKLGPGRSVNPCAATTGAPSPTPRQARMQNALCQSKYAIGLLLGRIDLQRQGNTTPVGMRWGMLSGEYHTFHANKFEVPGVRALTYLFANSQCFRDNSVPYTGAEGKTQGNWQLNGESYWIQIYTDDEFALYDAANEVVLDLETETVDNDPETPGRE